MCLAYLGHRVFCVDTDIERIRTLSRGETPIFEPHLETLLAEAKPNLCFFTDYAAAVPKADVVFVAVGTPPSADGTANLDYVRSAAHAIGENLEITSLWW